MRTVLDADLLANSHFFIITDHELDVSVGASASSGKSVFGRVSVAGGVSGSRCLPLAMRHWEMSNSTF